MPTLLKSRTPATAWNSWWARAAAAGTAEETEAPAAEAREVASDECPH